MWRKHEGGTAFLMSTHDKHVKRADIPECSESGTPASGVDDSQRDPPIRGCWIRLDCSSLAVLSGKLGG
jgi:hypothetical protein